MEDTTGREYFTHPIQTYHRRYEALRAVIVEGRSQKEVADTFGFQYRSVRQLVYEFRQFRDSDRKSTESPFFETSMWGVPPQGMTNARSPQWPIGRN